MRLIGYVLVVLGAVALGCEGLLGAKAAAGQVPVLAGISLVSGLLLLALFGRRQEN